MELDASPSLADFAADAFGDMGDPTPAAETPTAPAAAPAAAPTPEPVAAEPATPAAVVPTPAPAAEPVAAVTDDPLKDAVPFTFQSDGQAKTYDGIRVLGTDGAIIDAAALPGLAQKLSEHAHLMTANQRLYAETQTLKQQTDGLTHKWGEIEYKGADGFNKMAADFMGVTQATARIYAALNDPTFVQQLGLAYQDGNEAAAKALLGNLHQSAADAADKAQWTTLRDRTQAVQQVSQQQSITARQEADRARAPNYAFEKVLTAYPALNNDADKTFIANYFRSYGAQLFRPAATAAEAQQAGVNVGDVIIDYGLMDVVMQDRATLRAEQAKIAAATSTATQENAARLAQAARPAARPAVASRPAPTATNSRAKDADAAWDSMENLASGRR